MDATLSQPLLDTYAASLSSTEQRGAFHDCVRELQMVSAAPKSLPDFLAVFGHAVANLFSATAVGIWFRSPADNASIGEFHRKFELGWEHLDLHIEHEQAHLDLIMHASQSSHPLACQPFSAPARHEVVSNPLDSYLLLTSVHYDQQCVAVLEIALGPTPLRLPEKRLLEGYLEWLNWLSGLLQKGIAKSFTHTHNRMLQAVETVRQAAITAEAMQNRIRIEIEKSLHSLAGLNFGTLADNQAVAKQIHQLLDSKGLRVRCGECGEPSILRCQNAGNSKTGVFTFDHYLESGRTFHGGQTILPTLSLVPKPARRSKKQA